MDLTNCANNLTFIYGSAGSGKSTIAASILNAIMPTTTVIVHSGYAMDAYKCFDGTIEDYINADFTQTDLCNIIQAFKRPCG